MFAVTALVALTAAWSSPAARPSSRNAWRPSTPRPVALAAPEDASEPSAMDALVQAARAQAQASKALAEGIEEMEELELELALELGYASVEEMEAALDGDAALEEIQPSSGAMPQPQAYDIKPFRRRTSSDPSMLDDGAIETGRRVAINVLIGSFAANALPALANTRRVFTASTGWSLSPAAVAAEESPPKFRRLARLQFIAALGDPKASSGTGADTWGLWREDPGPEGVRLSGYRSKLEATGGKAPAGWQFDKAAWWLEEHGLIMPGVEPLPSAKLTRDGETVSVSQPFKRYVVTGDREVTSVLTVRNDGSWELSKGTLYDVTHLPCRSALYTPAAAGGECTPANANPADFPVKPGAAMPRVSGCAKQDYAVLFVVGVEA